MNKPLLLFAIAFLVFSNLQGQDLGIKAGMSVVNAENLGLEKNTEQIRANAGINVRFPLKTKFTLCIELMYSGKGYKSPDAGLVMGSKTKFEYLSLPLMMEYNLWPEFKLSLGPELGFLLHVESELQTDPNYKKAFKKLDFGLNAGIVNYLSKRFALEARYCYGFTHLAEISYHDALGNEIGQDHIGGNRMFQFGIFFIFKRGGAKR